MPKPMAVLECLVHPIEPASIADPPCEARFLVDLEDLLLS